MTVAPLVLVQGFGVLTLDQPLSLDPGTYSVQASGAGRVGSEVEIEVLPGVTTVLSFNLVARGAAEIAEALERAAFDNLVQITGFRLGEASCGTGFFAGANGLILTTYRTIRGAEDLRVEVGGTDVINDVQVAAYDADLDMAVVQVPLRRPDSLPIAADAAVDRSYVWGFGHPQCGTATSTPTRLTAAVGPELGLESGVAGGDQGGPLIDNTGEVVALGTGPSTALAIAGADAVLNEARQNVLASQLLAPRQVAVQENHLYGHSRTWGGRLSMNDTMDCIHCTSTRDAVRSTRFLLVVIITACGDPSGPALTPVVQLAEVERHANQTTISIAGSTAANATIEVAGGAVLATGIANAQGGFAVSVSLKTNQANELSVVASLSGVRSDAVTVTVIHDDVVPTLTIQSPTGAAFDTDGDSRVNIHFSFADAFGGIDEILVTNDRPVGAGAESGGVDAGTNLLSANMIEPGSVTYNASLDHEFPVGTNHLTVSLADSAGNGRSDTVEFTVSGTEPSLTITQPSDGEAPPEGGVVVMSEFSDVAGRIDESGLVFVADQDLIGLLSQDGTQGDDVEAGQSFSHLFDVTGATAEFRAESSYAFAAGEMTITGLATDRAGNTSEPDAVTFTFPASPHTLLAVNSTAAAGAVAHVVPIGLTSFAPFRGVQFTVAFDASVMTVDSLKSAGRVPFSAFFEQSIVGDAGEVEVVLVDFGGDPISEGSGVVVNIYTSVSASAAVQDMALAISGAEVADENGNPVDIVLQDGVLRIR